MDSLLRKSNYTLFSSKLQCSTCRASPYSISLQLICYGLLSSKNFHKTSWWPHFSKSDV